MPCRARIMIVEADPTEIRMLESAFERARWMVDIEAITSGKRALDAMYRNHLMRKPADMIMLSGSPNGESCLQTLRSMRGHPKIRNQPVIVFSSTRPAPDMAHACSLLGALKFLVIPADLSNWILPEIGSVAVWLASRLFPAHEKGGIGSRT
jgi:CheY-like chemotaxis protein